MLLALAQAMTRLFLQVCATTAFLAAAAASAPAHAVPVTFNFLDGYGNKLAETASFISPDP